MPDETLPVDVPVGCGSIICYSNPGNKGFPYTPPMVQTFNLSAATAIEIESGTLYSYDDGTAGLHINRNPNDASKLAVYLHYGSFFHYFTFSFTATTAGEAEKWSGGTATFEVHGLVIGADRPRLPSNFYELPVGQTVDFNIKALCQLELGDMAVVYVQGPDGAGVDRADLSLYFNQIRDPDTGDFEHLQVKGEVKKLGYWNVGIASSSVNRAGSSFDAGSMAENVVFYLYDGGGRGNAGLAYGDLVTAVRADAVSDATVYVSYYDGEEFGDADLAKNVAGAFDFDAEADAYRREVRTGTQTAGEVMEYEFGLASGTWTLGGRHYDYMATDGVTTYCARMAGAVWSAVKPAYVSMATVAEYSVGLASATFTNIPPRAGWMPNLYVTNNPTRRVDGVGFLERVDDDAPVEVYQLRPEHTPQYEGWTRPAEHLCATGELYVNVAGAWYHGRPGVLSVAETEEGYTVTGGTAVAEAVGTVDYIAVPYAPVKAGDLAMQAGGFAHSIHTPGTERTIVAAAVAAGYWARYPLRRLNSVRYTVGGAFSAALLRTEASGRIDINDFDLDYKHSDNHETHRHWFDHKTTATGGTTSCSVTGQTVSFCCAEVASGGGGNGDNNCTLVRLWGYSPLPGGFGYGKTGDSIYTDYQTYAESDVDSGGVATRTWNKVYDEKITTTLRGGTHAQPVATGNAFGWLNFAHGRAAADPHRKLLASASVNVSTSVSNLPIVERSVKTRDIVETETQGGQPVPHDPVHVVDYDTTTQTTDSFSFGDNYLTFAREMDVNGVRNLGHATERKTVRKSASYNFRVYANAFDGSRAHFVPYRGIDDDPVVGTDSVSIEYEYEKAGGVYLMQHCSYRYSTSYGPDTDPSRYVTGGTSSEEWGDAAGALYATAVAKYNAVKSSGVIDAPAQPANGDRSIGSSVTFSESENTETGQLVFI